MHLSTSFALHFAAAASAAAFHKRQETSSFQLFAYGEGIGGLPLVSTGSEYMTASTVSPSVADLSTPAYIYVGDLKTLNNTEAAPIVCVYFQETPNA